MIIPFAFAYCVGAPLHLNLSEGGSYNVNCTQGIYEVTLPHPSQYSLTLEVPSEPYKLNLVSGGGQYCFQSNVPFQMINLVRAGSYDLNLNMPNSNVVSTYETKGAESFSISTAPLNTDTTVLPNFGNSPKVPCDTVPHRPAALQLTVTSEENSLPLSPAKSIAQDSLSGSAQSISLEGVTGVLTDTNSLAKIQYRPNLHLKTTS